MSDEKPAILGGTPIRTKPFPPRPLVRPQAIEAVAEILRKGHLSHFYKNPRGGETIQKFEEEVAKYHGVQYAISVNSGTAALHTALEAAEVKQYSRVLVPAYTFTATATAVVMRGAIPTLIDVDLKDGNINVDQIKIAIRNFGEQVSAIIPVHIMGTPANMDEIIAIADSHKLTVIEDAAQAAGASYKGKKVGTFGKAGILSFQETKPIPAGEGGIIVTNDQQLAEKAMLIRNHGEIYGNNGEGALLIGRNYRLIEYVAAVALDAFRQIDYINGQNRANAAIINEAIKKVRFLEPLIASDDSYATFSRFPFRINPTIFYNMCGIDSFLPVTKEFGDPKKGHARAIFLEALKAEGIEMNGGYKKALFEYPLFRNIFYYNMPGIAALMMANMNEQITTAQQLIYQNTMMLVHEQAIWFTDHLYPSTQKDARDVAKAILKVSTHIKEIATAIGGKVNV